MDAPLCDFSYGSLAKAIFLKKKRCQIDEMVSLTKKLIVEKVLYCVSPKGVIFATGNGRFMVNSNRKWADFS